MQYSPPRLNQSNRSDNMSADKQSRIRETRFVEIPDRFDQTGFYFKQNPDQEVGSEFDPEKLPFPEKDFLKYSQDSKTYRKTGRRDAKKLRRLLIKHGVPNKKGPGNFLEFGCANARVMRWFADWAEHGEAWGVDIDASLVFWCHQNLSPPFHFAVSTTQPNLFFEDRFFSLVFATSIFTHIDDLYLSWICELRRITKPGGFIFITIHDENTHKQQAEANSNGFKTRMSHTVYRNFIDEKADFCTCQRDLQSLVSFRREYIIKHLSRLFDVVDVIDRAMAAQTGILLRKKM